ncbi:alpha/beta hydrolase [Anaerolinea thermophila]|uniref:Hydrolase n=2 Tax=Anaerolinea TaxID=233189 RepID=E8MZ18_ANATU|nr:alpha/beta hydrolase [Anaerolinea thermophila]BAJ62161.1 putative hydrolase [Anaerolinea thermophila UNI-1]
MSFVSQLFLGVLRLFPFVPHSNWSIHQQRDVLEFYARLLLHTPPGVRIGFAAAGGPRAEWLIPERNTPDQVILYLHGGAYTVGSPRTHREMVGYLSLFARTRALVVDYRLAPEHPFPAALEDALAAYHHLQRLGYPPHKIAFAGDSAGGGLAMATLLALRDRGEPLPAAAALMSPWTDLAGVGESVKTHETRDPLINPADLPVAARLYLRDLDPRHPYASPLYGDFHGLPPILVHVGTEEILYTDSTRLVERLLEDGVDAKLVVWEGMWHVFQLFTLRVPESWRSLRQMGSFLHHHLSRAQAEETNPQSIQKEKVPVQP